MSKYTKGKNGLYQTKVAVGINSTTGKIIRKSIYAKTIKQLEEQKFKLNEQNKIFKKNYINSIGIDITMLELSEKWFQLFQSINADTTQEMYFYALKHINNEFGYQYVRNIDPESIQILLNKHIAHPESSRKILLTLKQLFSFAVEKEIISKNPCDSSIIKIPTRVITEKRILFPEELNAIQNIAFSPKENFLVHILLYLGLRPEEVKGLSPSDFNTKNNTVEIKRAAIYSYKQKKMIVKETKTSSGNRTLYIPQPARKSIYSFLESIGNRSYCLSSTKSDVITNTGYRIIFNNIVDKIQEYNGIDYKKILPPADYEFLIQTARKNKKKPFVNVNKLTSYTFRRNYATTLYYSNVSLKQAAKLMGHSDISMILKVYAQLDEQKENVYEKLDNMVFTKH